MVTQYSFIQPETSYSSVVNKDVTKKIEAPTRHEAMVLFENAKKRLNDINNWTLFSEKSPAEFQLTDGEGNLLSASTPQPGNLIKVRFHAPASDTQHAYIWYRIENFIHEKNLLKDTEDFGFNTRQIRDPFLSNDQADSNSGVTCIFMITRSGCIVSALEVETRKVFGHKTVSPFSKLRNKFSTMLDLVNPSNHQWKPLLNGVLQ